MYVRRNQNAGFTLVELLLYIVIVSTLLLTITGLFAMSADARVKNQSISEVNQQGTAVMEQLTQTIRNADAITAPTVGATGTSLTLTVPTGALSPTIFNASGGATGTLQIKEGVATAISLTSSKVQVSGLSFKNLSRATTPGTVQISFVMARVNAGNSNQFDYQKTFTTTASLRP